MEGREGGLGMFKRMGRGVFLCLDVTLLRCLLATLLVAADSVFLPAFFGSVSFFYLLGAFEIAQRGERVGDKRRCEIEGEYDERG